MVILKLSLAIEVEVVNIIFLGTVVLLIIQRRRYKEIESITRKKGTQNVNV